MRSVGIIGVGIQGTAIAQMLLQNSIEVHVHDISSTQMLCAKDLGAQCHDSITSLLHCAEIIFFILPPGKSPLHLLSDPLFLQNIATKHTIVQMGTTSAISTEKMRQIAEDNSFSFCEAVIGGPIATILDKSCPLFFGGTAEQKDIITPLTKHFGSLISIGSIGKGCLFNIAALTHVYTIIHGYSIASAMIQRAGIEAQLWLDFINDGIGGHPGEFLTKFWWPAHIEHRSYGLIGPAQVKNDTALAEINIIRNQAQQHQLDTGMLLAMERIHQQACALSAQRDWSSIFDQIAPEMIIQKEFSNNEPREHSVQQSFPLLEIISTDVPVLFPHSTIREAVEAFEISGVSDLAVLNPIDRSFLGILSEGELLTMQLSNTEKFLSPSLALAEFELVFLHTIQSLRSKIIGPFILRTPFCASPHQDIFSLATVMGEKKIQHLPVVQGTTYFGIISRRKLLARLVQQ